MSLFIQPVVEDIIHEWILIKLFGHYRKDLTLYSAIGRKGNSYIKGKLKGYNEASKFLPHVIITDLDDIDCPVSLRNDWLKFNLSKKCMFRIAIREGEAWLFADRVGFPKFIGVPVNKIPLDSETILNPKEFIISLARKSHKKQVRKDIVPEGISVVGPGYNQKIVEFIVDHWNLNEAIRHSKSLSKTIDRVNKYLK